MAQLYVDGNITLCVTDNHIHIYVMLYADNTTSLLAGRLITVSIVLCANVDYCGLLLHFELKMAAILRVKRKIIDSPLDAFVIACKRPKTEVSASDTPPVETVVQFAATLTDPTEDAKEHIALIIKNDKAGVKRVADSSYPTNISGKITKSKDKASVSDRYKVVDYQRSLDTYSEEKDQWMTLIDVEDSWNISCSMDQDTEKKEDIEDYVYDLYYTQSFGDVWLESDNILVRPEYSVNVNFQDDEADSSDSNAESHWKNDYPDTESDESSEDMSSNGNGGIIGLDRFRRTENDDYDDYLYEDSSDSSNSDLDEESLMDDKEE